MTLKLTAQTISTSVLRGMVTGALLGSLAGIGVFLVVAAASSLAIPALAMVGAFAGFVWGAIIGGYAGLATADASAAMLNHADSTWAQPDYIKTVTGIV